MRVALFLRPPLRPALRLGGLRLGALRLGGPEAGGPGQWPCPPPAAASGPRAGLCSGSGPRLSPDPSWPLEHPLFSTALSSEEDVACFPNHSSSSGSPRQPPGSGGSDVTERLGGPGGGAACSPPAQGGLSADGSRAKGEPGAGAGAGTAQAGRLSWGRAERALPIPGKSDRKGPQTGQRVSAPSCPRARCTLAGPLGTSPRPGRAGEPHPVPGGRDALSPQPAARCAFHVTLSPDAEGAGLPVLLLLPPSGWLSRSFCPPVPSLGFRWHRWHPRGLCSVFQAGWVSRVSGQGGGRSHLLSSALVWGDKVM